MIAASARSLLALVPLLAASPGAAVDEARELTACEAAELASRMLPWGYRVADGLRCTEQATWRVPRAERAWLEDQAAEKGLLVVEKVDETVLEAVPDRLAQGLEGAARACASALGHSRLAVVRLAVAHDEKLVWIEGEARAVLDEKAEACLLKVLDAQRLGLTARGGLPTLYRAAWPGGGGKATSRSGKAARKRNRDAKGSGRSGRGPVDLDALSVEDGVLARPFGPLRCLDDASDPWRAVTVRFTLDGDARPEGMAVDAGEAPVAVMRCLEREMPKLRFAGPRGARGRYTFRRLHAFSYGGATRHRPSRPRPLVDMTVCEAVQRATVQSGWAYQVARDVSCEKSMPWRPAHPLSESGAWLDDQALRNGFVVVESPTATTLQMAGEAIERLRTGVRRCDFGRTTLKDTGREVNRPPPLSIAVQVKADGTYGWIAGGGDPLPERAASCVAERLVEVGAPLTARGGHTVYKLLLTGHAPGVFTGAVHDEELRIPDEKQELVGRLLLDHRRVHRVVKENRERLFFCFRRDTGGLVDGVTVRRVRLRWEIAQDGSVTKVDVVDDAGAEEVAGCLTDRVQGLIFALPDGTKRYYADYTFVGASLGDFGGVPDVIELP